MLPGCGDSVGAGISLTRLFGVLVIWFQTPHLIVSTILYVHADEIFNLPPKPHVLQVPKGISILPCVMHISSSSSLSLASHSATVSMYVAPAGCVRFACGEVLALWLMIFGWRDATWPQSAGWGQWDFHVTPKQYRHRLFRNDWMARNQVWWGISERKKNTLIPSTNLSVPLIS